MNDNIIFRTIWKDNEVIQLEVECSSAIATIISKIYVSEELIDKLVDQIMQFLGGKIEEGLWANEDKGNASTACVALRFIKKDKLGHILVEVFAELDDGSDYAKHNCCFFVNTEYGLLMNFCDSLAQLKENPAGCEIQLNCQ